MGMEETLAAPPLVETPPPTTPTPPTKSSSLWPPPRKTHSKEKKMGEAEETQTHLQTQSDCQGATQTQKKVSTDSMEPPLCQTLLYKRRNASSYLWTRKILTELCNTLR